MNGFNFRHVSGSRFFPGVRSGIILGIVMLLVLTACGDQNPSLTSQGAADGGQVSSPSEQVQNQPATTAVSAKITPKPVATAANLVHICSLLTKDDVAPSIGTVVEIQASADGLGEFGGANCSYVSSTGGLTVQVNIADETQADFEKNAKTSNPQAVPGLGDAAFFQGGQLSTLKGKIVLVLLLVNPTNGSDTLSNATALTQKVLTSIAKTNLASDLTDSVPAPAGGANKAPAIDLPVYPGSVLVRNDSTGGFNITTYTSSDSYSVIVNWYKQVVAGKPWTGNVTSEVEAGNIVISAGNATSPTASHLLIDIKGPEKADRNPGLDAKGNPIVLSPDSTLISLTIY